GCVLVPKHVGPKPAIEGLLIGFEHILAQAKASMKKSLVILVRGIEMVNQVQQGPPVKSGELGFDISPRGLRFRLTFCHTRLRYPARMRNSQRGCLTQKQ